jgi:hypothetical protein
MKSKLLFDGKVFHLIEGVNFAGYPIYSSGEERIVIKDGEVIHRNIIIEQRKFLRRKNLMRRRRNDTIGV